MTLTLDPGLRKGAQQRQPRALLIEPDRLRMVIGGIGVLLPFLLVAAAWLRPTKDLDVFLHSLSSYYYTSGIAVLEGTLFTLALFLLVYRGYPNKYKWADEWAARLAAGAALVIALFPTYPPEKVPPPLWWREEFGMVHDWASVVMFLMFALFALWLFRKTDAGMQDLPRGKQWRNRVYLVCGLTIVGSTLWIAFLLKTGHTDILVPEAFAIAGFAVAFLVKGGAARRWMPSDGEVRTA